MQANLPRITEAINYNFRLVDKCEDSYFWLGLICCGLCDKEGHCHLLVPQSLYKYVNAKTETRNDVQRKPDQTENVIRRLVGGRGGIHWQISAYGMSLQKAALRQIGKAR